MTFVWTDILGYSALVINLFSMSMSDVAKLRVLSIIANSLYLVYGLFLHAPPLIFGCFIAVCLHSYRLYKLKNHHEQTPLL